MEVINIEEVKQYLLALQRKIKRSLQSYESRPFIIDEWQRAQGQGGGITCILRHGKVLESAGVNFSHISGESMPTSATAHRAGLGGRSFEVLGVSCVIHPQNPYVPTTHMNVRFFVAYKKNEPAIWWFGGGFDLTPYYPERQDVIYWHQMANKACQSFGEGIYSHYKAWADRYFYLPHRNETRGVGGLFFDDLNTATWGWDYVQCFHFMQSVGNHFWTAYGPLLERHYQRPYTDRERDFQLYRRGRYVEFNLLYDRGTLFGLQSGGRTESILMSLPPKVAWDYRWQPSSGSPESQLYEQYLRPQEWLK